MAALGICLSAVWCSCIQCCVLIQNRLLDCLDFISDEDGQGPASPQIIDTPIYGAQLENLSELRAPDTERAGAYLDAALAALRSHEGQYQCRHLTDQILQFIRPVIHSSICCRLWPVNRISYHLYFTHLPTPCGAKTLSWWHSDRWRSQLSPLHRHWTLCQIEQ